MKIGDVEVLSLTEAAARLGLKPNTLNQQIKNGAFKASLIGGRYVVTVEEVERYDQQRKTRGFAKSDHPMHGKQGPGHRRKKVSDE